MRRKGQGGKQEEGEGGWEEGGWERREGMDGRREGR